MMMPKLLHLVIVTSLVALQQTHPPLTMAEDASKSVSGSRRSSNLRRDVATPTSTALLGHHRANINNKEAINDDLCDESFPLAPPSSILNYYNNNPDQEEYRIVLPNDPERRTHAPLCFTTTSTTTNNNNNQQTPQVKELARINLRKLTTCSPGQCFVPAYQDCFHSTSFECNSDIPVAPPKPTPRPTVPIVTSVHPIQFKLRNVPQDYVPNAEVRSYILRWVTEQVGEELDERLELVRVEYAGRLKALSVSNLFPASDGGLFDSIVGASAGGGDTNENGNDDKEVNWVAYKGPRPDSDNGRRNLRSSSSSSSSSGHQSHHRRLASTSIALKVTTRGPIDISDFALSYIMEIVRDNFSDLIAYLRKNQVSLTGNFMGGTGNVFGNLDMEADTFDFGDIMEDNDGMNDVVVTVKPTWEPTPSPVFVLEEVIEEDATTLVVKVVDETSNTDTDIDIRDTETTGIPWWVWLIVILAIILCCLCSCCFWRRRKQGSGNNKKTQETEINIWMNNGVDDTRKPRKSRGSVVGSREGDARSKRTRHSRRSSAGPPRSIATRRDGGDVQSKRTSNNNRHSQNKRNSRPMLPKQVSQRKMSQTEIEEEERERNHNYDNYDDNNDDDDQGYSVMSEAITIDPPEENALVPYEHQKHLALTNGPSSDEPYGSKPPRYASMMAEDVYYGAGVAKHGGMNPEKEGTTNTDRISEEPTGAKIPKKQSMFASEAIISHSSRTRGGGKRKPQKDTLFVCSLDSLPEDVRSKTNKPSRDPTQYSESVENEQRRKSSSKNGKRKKPRKREIIEGLRSSLTRGRSSRHPPQQAICDDDQFDDMEKEAVAPTRTSRSSPQQIDNNLADSVPRDLVLAALGDNHSVPDSPSILTVHQDEPEHTMAVQANKEGVFVTEEDSREQKRHSDVDGRMPSSSKKKKKSSKKKKQDSTDSGVGRRSSRRPQKQSMFSSFTKRLSSNDISADVESLDANEF